MRLRYLKKAHGRQGAHVWPPAWDGLPSDGRGKTVLVAVRRIGTRLSITARSGEIEDVAFLDEWKPPPSIDDVEAALVAMIGHTIQEAGEMDTEAGAGAPLDRFGF